MMQLKRFASWALMAYVILVMLLSVLKINGSSSLSESTVAGLRSDYLLHVLLFVPYMLLAHWRWRDAENEKKWFWPVAGAGLALAVLSEGVQWFLPYRTFNPIDLLANAGGIILGVVIAGWRKKVGSRK